MWRDSATTTTMAKTPSAWGTANDMTIPRNGVSGPPTSGGPPVVGAGGSEGPGGPGGPAGGGHLKFMFSPEDMTESVLFGGPSQKIAGLEVAMERLNMVRYFHIYLILLSFWVNWKGKSSQCFTHPKYSGPKIALQFKSGTN